jgi:DNA (cytosine-5)-methyltransferase 1
MHRPKLLDLFCGAGGAGMGYHRAGFDVTGVDLAPQKRYPFTFIQGDALEYVAAHGHEFDAIHASPPCQAYCDLRALHPEREYPDLIADIRRALAATGRPYVIENNDRAPLRAPVLLCGTMFGLGTGDRELWRHRMFETTIGIILTPQCAHRTRPKVVGVYGGSGGHSRREGGPQMALTHERREAMGIDWMTRDELSQAIPPAYAEFIGRQLLAAVSSQEAA